MPVDVATGVQYTAWEDLEIAGQYALGWRRYYSTSLIDRPVTAQGRGWRHGFDVNLLYRDGRYLFQGPDGADIVFDDTQQTLDKAGRLLNPHDYELRREGAKLCVYHWHDWESEVHRFVFSRPGVGVSRLERLEFPSTIGLGLKYDGRGRLAEVRQDIEGRAIQLEYGPRGTITALYLESPVASRELICTFQFDSQDRLIGAIDGTRVPHQYEYDEQHRLILERPRSGGAYRMKYDAQGRCIEVSGDHRYGYRRIAYNEPAKVSIVTDSLGRQTTYQLNDRGQVVTEGRPNGAITRREFDDQGRVLATIGPLDQATRYTYDERGNVSEVVHPNGGSLTVAYDDHHLPTSVTEPDGATWTLQQERGALVGVTDPLGRKLSYVRDDRNLLTEIHTPAGNHIAVRRDDKWSEESYTDGFGLIVRWLLDQRLNTIAVYDARGLVRTLQYDAQSRLVAVAQADGSREEFVCDAAGQLVKYVDPNGGVISVEYSTYSDFVSLTNANGATHRFTTDTESRLTAITGPQGERATFGYDAVDNRTHASFFDGRVESYRYDTLNRMISKEKSDGTTLRYVYGATESIEKVISDGTVLVENSYDLCGQLLKTVTPSASVLREFDVCGRLVLEQQDDSVITYTMGVHGFVETCKRRGAGIDGQRFLYDVRGRLVSLGTLEVAHQLFEYDAADLVLRRQCGGATEAFEYDARRRISLQSVIAKAGHDIIRRRFEYDANSNLLLESDALRGDVRYAYGPSGLLLRSDHSVRGSTAYVYDLSGNMLSRGSETFAYGTGNRLVRRGDVAFESDANGNRTVERSPTGVTRFEWDALDQLVAIVHPDGHRTEYTYDGLGRRTRKTAASGAVTRYFWAGDSLLGVETADGTREYLAPEFYPLAMWDSGVVKHIIVSHRDIPYELLDENGAIVWTGEYDDWGAPAGPSRIGVDPLLGLPGQQQDSESGLHYTRFRYYDPADTRFLSPDPWGTIGGLNGFLYAPNAINWTDPLGLSCNKGSHKNSVYVLKKNGKIVYVGITNRPPKTRMREHARTTGKRAKDFDEMVVIAEGLSRRQARNIEGSALLNIQKGDVVHSDGTAMKLQNAPRKSQPGTYCHSYNDNTSGPGRQVQTPDDTVNHLNNNLASYPNP